MKKILKKTKMLLCAMAVAIGFVGGTVGEASAASKNVYGGTSNIQLVVAKGYNDYECTIELQSQYKNTLTKRTNKLVWNNEKKDGIANANVTYKKTTNDKCYLKVTVKDTFSGITKSDTISIKLNTLEKKNFKVKIKNTSKGLTGVLKSVSISKVNK